MQLGYVGELGAASCGLPQCQSVDGRRRPRELLLPQLQIRALANPRGGFSAILQLSGAAAMRFSLTESEAGMSNYSAAQVTVRHRQTARASSWTRLTTPTRRVDDEQRTETTAHRISNVAGPGAFAEWVRSGWADYGPSDQDVRNNAFCGRLRTRCRTDAGKELRWQREQCA